ncbi:MAG: PhoH family protein [Limisphaerales bacterium]
MKKNYLLDTNVLLHDPDSITSFQDNHVLLPIEVIEEVDRFKRETSELGRNARTVSRLLDNLRTKGSLRDGVPTPGGGTLRILFGDPAEPQPVHGKAVNGVPRSVDNRILSRALAARGGEPGLPLIVVSKDINLRLKADAQGLTAEDYETDRVQLTALYSGMFERHAPAAQLAEFKENGELPLPAGRKYLPNEYCTLMEDTNPKRTLLGKVDATATKLVPIVESREGVWGIKPRNREQHFALDALLDDRIKLVTLMGKAGTGKTLLALAAGLRRTVVDREFRRVLVARPTVSLGREIGFLPGSLEEKLAPWMQPIHDALELLSDLNMGQESRRSADLMRNGSIVVEALSYIRGRSIPHQFMIIDEAQNLTPLEVKTIVTRVGHGAKLVFTGDPWQIDNPYVDSSSNGFVHLVDTFRGQPLFAHVELQKGERSELAELAANLL